MSFSIATAQTPTSDPWSVLVSPENSFNLWILNHDQPVLSMSTGGWAPKFAWRSGPTSNEKAKGDTLTFEAPFELEKVSKEIINTRVVARQTSERAVTYQYELSADNDVSLTMLKVGFSSLGTHKGSVVLTQADGKQTTLTLPIPRAPAIIGVTHAIFQINEIGDVDIGFDPAINAEPEYGDLRLVLAKEIFSAGLRKQSMTITTPQRVRFKASEQEVNAYIKPLAGPGWFPFTPTNDNTSPSIISVQDWLDKPAGKHGGVRMVKDHFQFTDGTPIKFWGTNLSYNGCAPTKNIADEVAARFAKYGVNSVRLHKFLGPSGWEGFADLKDATQMEPKGLDRFDYFTSQLKDRGVYFGFSHTFMFVVAPENKARLLAYDEIHRNLKDKTYALINFAPDVQDLFIERIVNLLSHKNPYTGLTYAQEPALSFLECQNEDDIFFYSSTTAFKACPTYAKALRERWCDWLAKKYGTRAAIAAAWKESLRSDENLDTKTIAIEINPWNMGDDNLPKVQPGMRQRYLDNAAFLHQEQNNFYSKFVKAVRDAGYQGPLIGSPWQAPAMLPHYYNLYSDYLAGYIDRHNYAGGPVSYSTLAEPGAGLLSTGLQQVVDRPFGISEWIHVYPSLYSAEGPVIMAAYVMGLQGWDSSYEFQSSAGGFAQLVGKFAFGIWEADVPTQLGQYPALTRMVLRGDVKEGAIISTRNVSAENLKLGEFNFNDKVTQNSDVKTFGGSVPPEALAAGRVVVAFTEKNTPSILPDMSQFKNGTTITSQTGQLKWDTANRGYVTINTEGTKGVVGFAEGKNCELGQFYIQLQCPYASLLVTALDKDKTLATTKTALVSAVARSANTGFTYFTINDKYVNNGSSPIQLEPVKAKITIANRPIECVNVLDQEGRLTAQKLEVHEGTFTIDGAKDHTLYYQIVFR